LKVIAGIPFLLYRSVHTQIGGELQPSSKIRWQVDGRNCLLENELPHNVPSEQNIKKLENLIRAMHEWNDVDKERRVRLWKVPVEDPLLRLGSTRMVLKWGTLQERRVGSCMKKGLKSLVPEQDPPGFDILSWLEYSTRSSPVNLPQIISWELTELVHNTILQLRKQEGD